MFPQSWDLRKSVVQKPLIHICPEVWTLPDFPLPFGLFLDYIIFCGICVGDFIQNNGFISVSPTASQLHVIGFEKTSDESFCQKTVDEAQKDCQSRRPTSLSRNAVKINETYEKNIMGVAGVQDPQRREFLRQLRVSKRRPAAVNEVWRSR